MYALRVVHMYILVCSHVLTLSCITDSPLLISVFVPSLQKLNHIGNFTIKNLCQISPKDPPYLPHTPSHIAQSAANIETKQTK